MKKKPKGSAAPEPKLLHDEACSVKEAIDMFAIIAGQFSDPIKKPETKQREIMQQLAAAHTMKELTDNVPAKEDSWKGMKISWPANIQFRTGTPIPVFWERHKLFEWFDDNGYAMWFTPKFIRIGSSDDLQVIDREEYIELLVMWLLYGLHNIMA